MTDLVKFNHLDLTKATAFTTSEIIANIINREHENVIRLIDNIKEDLDIVDKYPLRFENREAKTSEGNTYTKRIAILTRPQAMLLLTHMRDNKASGRKIAKFKLELVKEFNRMEFVLATKREILPESKIISKDYSDFIHYINSGCDPREDLFVKFSFKYYNDLIYKKLFGETGKQRRDRLKLKPKDNVLNTFDADENRKIIDLKMAIKKQCIQAGWIKLKPNEAYKKVKEWLETV